MKKYECLAEIRPEHIDAGDHANWLKQLEIAQDMHFRFRESVGLGLQELREKHGLFFVMREVQVLYSRPLVLDDVIRVCLEVSVFSPTRVEYQARFKKLDDVYTEIKWIMPLVFVATGKPCALPKWMLERFDPSL